MGKSVSLINNILESNHLIKGRLNVEYVELKKLYAALQKNDERLKNKQSHHEKIIKSQINKRNAIKFQRKRNFESLQKSFYPITTRVSLLYKNQGGAYYIKARFYWEGRQREVQVGSISIVSEIVNTMIDNKILMNMKKLKTNKLSWKQINSHPELIDAIKGVASLKAQEYIIRKLLAFKIKIVDNIDNQDQKDENKSEVIETSQYSSSNDPSSIEEKQGGVEWYEKWREKNL